MKGLRWRTELREREREREFLKINGFILSVYVLYVLYHNMHYGMGTVMVLCPYVMLVGTFF